MPKNENDEYSSSQNRGSDDSRDSRTRKRELERNRSILIFEIIKDSSSGEFRETTLSSLLSDILDEANATHIHSDVTINQSNPPVLSFDDLTNRGNPAEMSSVTTWRRSRSGSSLQDLLHTQSTLGNNHQPFGLLKPPEQNGHHRHLLSSGPNHKDSYHNHISRNKSPTSNTTSALDLRIRDLRRMDFSINRNEEIRVLVRRHCVIFTADPLRALITDMRLILFVPPGADSLITRLEDYMTDSLNILTRSPFVKTTDDTNVNGTSTIVFDSPVLRRETSDEVEAFIHEEKKVPFEELAYEAVLACCRDLHQLDYINFQLQWEEISSDFRGAVLVSFPSQKKMKILKMRVGSLIAKMSRYKQSLDEIDLDDEKLALMNLSTLKMNPYLYRYPLSPDIMRLHEEVENVLDAYLSDFTTMEIRVKTILKQIVLAEEEVLLRLQIAENKALGWKIILSVTNCGILFATYIVGVFGTNCDHLLWILNDDDFVNGTASSSNYKPFSDKSLPGGNFLCISMLTFLMIPFITSIFYYVFILNGVIPTEM